MRIRFNEQVEVDFSVPSPLPAGNLPPLLFATFVENAFKHGVSYQHPSFVHIAFSVEAGRLHFNCVNSRSQRPASSDSGGLGLRNVRQRLDLLFPNDYQLDIQDQADAYAVRLDIPLSLS
jgi:LytS/YehU family sensor histidine kinase